MNTVPTDTRLHALDAVRGFALLLGVAFHAALSFMPGWPPGIWATVDVSPSPFLYDAAFVAHIFRMSLFFFIAGFFARLLHQKLGERGFWSNRLKRIGIPLVVGWIVIAPTILFLWGYGLKQLTGGAPAGPPMPLPEDWFPLTHLWFLYQLLIVYALALGLRAVFVAVDAAGRARAFIDKVVAFCIRWPVAVFLLGLPLAAALAVLPFYFYWSGIPTPDSSLIPQVPATVGYGTAFAFGWLVHRSSGALAALTARWPLYLVLAVGATYWLIHTMHATPMDAPSTTRNVYAVTLGVAIWSWVFGLTGAALKFLSGYSAARRYIADASYWVYLAHLPVIAALQIWVAQWQLSWLIKFPLILVLGFAVLFGSYHLFVRSTFIGKILNGRKYPRRPNPPNGGAPNPTAPPPPPGNTDAPLARLAGVSKRFGKVTALAGVDLEVRAGELLAVLGPNGAGKSTAISVCLGLHEPDTGTVEILGGSPLETQRRLGLGVMMQDVELVAELRARELITLAASYYAHPMSVEEVLALTGTTQLADRRYGKLSGGQKRQVQFAVAIVGRPKLLFLDEPTVGLDVQARAALWASIRRLLSEGCSVVLTTHYLEEAEALANRVIVIAAGRVIASGSVADMRALVASRQINCETQISAEEVRGWPGVVSAALSAGEQPRLSITASDAEDVVRRLLTRDATLRRLEVREAGLSEAFTQLTREAA
jgi:ABC-type multidrug transport system ATPase subunit/peptidoglycan/LPS O-acetylase OafA/YrhL